MNSAKHRKLNIPSQYYSYLTVRRMSMRNFKTDLEALIKKKMLIIPECLTLLQKLGIQLLDALTIAYTAGQVDLPLQN